VGKQTPHPEHKNPPGLHPQPHTVLTVHHDCVARSSPNIIVKFVYNTVVVGLISGNDGKAYLEEVANLSLWCQDNNLMLNVSKTKELILNFRRTSDDLHTTGD